jgi:hypothetical protein
MIWDLYSPEQQLRRTQAIYEAAMMAYTSIVNEWFAALGSRMRMAVTLPAILRGTLKSPGPGATPGVTTWTPIIEWHLDPLPYGEASSVDIKFATGDEPPWPSERSSKKQQLDKLLKLRPGAVGWLPYVETQSVADVFQAAPLAPLVYDWLKKDLSAIKWA